MVRENVQVGLYIERVKEKPEHTSKNTKSIFNFGFYFLQMSAISQF